MKHVVIRQGAATGVSSAEETALFKALSTAPVTAARTAAPRSARVGATSNRAVRLRLAFGTAILGPLLVAIVAYGWSEAYFHDGLIALILSGLALVVLLPFASSGTTPGRRRPD